MAIKFSGITKHGEREFFPGVSVAFDDDRAEEYFVAAGWADTTKEKPLAHYAAGSVTIDPATVHAHGDKAGQPVLGGEA